MKTLLLVEHETGHAELMSGALSAAGYAVTLAGTLAEARAAIARKSPDLVLVDYNLPDGTGSELIAHVADGFPFLLMTAHGDEHLATQAMKAGALDYLVKSPAMFEQLPHTVERALRQWDLELERQRMMRALRESEERYRRITEGLTDYLYSVRVEQGMAVATTHGASCVVVTGYTAAEFAADPLLWIQMIVPADRDRVRAHLRGVLAGEQLPTVEHRIVRKDGKTRWVSDKSILHLDTAGRLTGYDGVIHDITAPKRAEAALRESEEKFAKVFHDAPVWITITDLADGTYLEVNERVLKDSGYSRAEMIGHTAVQIGWIAAAERAPVLQAIQTHGRVFGLDLTFQTKDNQVLFGLLNGERIDLEGRPCLLTVTIDITARKLAEEALKRERSLFDSLIRTIPDMVWLKDLDGVFLACNPVFERYFGAKKTEIVGKTDYDFVDKKTADAYRAGDRTVMARGQPAVSESWLSFLEGGQEGLFESIKATVFDSAGKPAGVLGIARDITARKQAEAEREKLETMNRQLQKSESLGRMAGAIAHHFNNQLQAVMLSLETAKSNLPQNAAPIEGLTEAVQSARAAAEVSTLMLTYLGQAQGNHESVDLAEVCQHSLPLLRVTMPQNVVLEADLPSPGPVISADANQLQQVLTNLITNAWEASGEGRGAIRLSVKTVSAADIPAAVRFPINWQPRDSAAAYACLEVADAGGAIAAKDFDKLFDPFFSTKFIGRGLGLPVVLGIARSHEGVVTVESESGRGSTFRVFIPVSGNALPQKPVFVPASPISQNIRRGTKVLVVEDEPMVRKTLALVLKYSGLTVLEAEDGVAAMEIFRQQRDEIGCVVCDLTMPRMNGWETLTALRQLAPGIGVILTSGCSEAQAMGGDHPEWPQALLRKPYEAKALINAINQILPHGNA